LHILKLPLPLLMLIAAATLLVSPDVGCAADAAVQADAAAQADDLAAPSYAFLKMEIPGPPPPPDDTSTEPSGRPSLGSDIKAYLTAPLHWERAEWAWFGGALLAIAAAHHYDTQVRTHFVKGQPPGTRIDPHDVQDAVPTVAIVAATWGYASLTDNTSGRREAWTMLEAAGLSAVSAYALKYAIGRNGPDNTSDPNAWRKGGSNSFPSYHTTAAFAVGTVLAESGNDEYRWLRRVLGYGLGVATGYERLKHNAHWLSDAVAGAALGIASARFSMNRQEPRKESTELSLEPVAGGALLTYRITLP
jgi:membrane-associated phospholipid phosphatase